MIDGRVVQRRPHSEPAEFPGVLVEGEISAGQGEETSGDFHSRGRKKEKTFFSKNEKTKGEKGAAYSCLVVCSVTLL